MKQIKIKTNLVGKEEVFKILALAQASKLGVLLQGAPGLKKLCLDTGGKYIYINDTEIRKYNASSITTEKVKV